MKQFKVWGVDVSDYNESDKAWFCVYFETLDPNVAKDETVEGYLTSSGHVEIVSYGDNYSLANLVIDYFSPYETSDLEVNKTVSI